MNLAQFAAFVGPPIATLMAIFALVVVRGTKVSEFRQKWIDDQRGDLAVILAQSGKLAAATAAPTGNDLVDFDLAAARIKLREKPRSNGLRRLVRWITFRSIDPEWETPIAKIQLIRNDLLTRAVPPASGFSMDTLQKELVTLSQIRLKSEWTRVRNGESGYKFLLLFAAFLASGPLIPLASSIIGSLLHTGTMPSPVEMMQNSGFKAG